MAATFDPEVGPGYGLVNVIEAGYGDLQQIATQMDLPQNHKETYIRPKAKTRHTMYMARAILTVAISYDENGMTFGGRTQVNNQMKQWPVTVRRGGRESHTPVTGHTTYSRRNSSRTHTLPLCM
jgi:hypothetical protein